MRRQGEKGRRSRRENENWNENENGNGEAAPLLPAGALALNYNSDSAVYDRDGGSAAAYASDRAGD